MGVTEVSECPHLLEQEGAAGLPGAGSPFCLLSGQNNHRIPGSSRGTRVGMCSLISRGQTRRIAASGSSVVPAAPGTAGPAPAPGPGAPQTRVPQPGSAGGAPSGWVRGHREAKDRERHGQPRGTMGTARRDDEDSPEGTWGQFRVMMGARGYPRGGGETPRASGGRWAAASCRDRDTASPLPPRSPRPGTPVT